MTTLTGRGTKSNCDKLVGYPPGHKYYKEKPKAQGQRRTKDFPKRSNLGGTANMIVMTTSDVSVDKHDSADKATLGGALFTPK